MTCWNCPSNYILPDLEGNLICHMCGAYAFQIIQLPMSIDIVKHHKKGVRGKSTIKVICIICGKKFETVNYGKNTKKICCDTCDSIRNIKYQKARRDIEKQQKLNEIQRGVLQ